MYIDQLIWVTRFLEIMLFHHDTITPCERQAYDISYAINRTKVYSNDQSNFLLTKKIKLRST